jgi:hypothetical protein
LIEAKPALENDKMEIGAESEDENEPVNNYDDEEKENTVRVEGGGDYLESRAKNIEMVRKLSSEFREELDAVLPKESKKKKPVSKKKGKKVQNEISVRRQSQRHKCAFSDRDKSLSHFSFSASYPLPSLRQSLLRTQLPPLLSSMKALLLPLLVRKPPHQTQLPPQIPCKSIPQLSPLSSMKALLLPPPVGKLLYQ